MATPESESVASLIDATSHVEHDEDVTSLPESDGDDYSTSTYTSDAEHEWEESLKQLELLLSMVIVPFVGKYLGRKCAYWAWARYMEWQLPVQVKITSPRTFRAVGVMEAAASL